LLAHKLAKELENLRTNKTLTWLRPDGKTQVTFANNELTSVLVSTQHSAEVTQEQIRKDLTEFLFIPVLGDVSKIKILVYSNPLVQQLIQHNKEKEDVTLGNNEKENNVDVYLLGRICSVCRGKVNTRLAGGVELIRTHYTIPGQQCPGTDQPPLKDPPQTACLYPEFELLLNLSD